MNLLGLAFQMQKSWRHVGFSDRQLAQVVEFAKKEQINVDEAIRWLLDGGLQYYNGGIKQAKLQGTSIHGDDRKEE